MPLKNGRSFRQKALKSSIQPGSGLQCIIEVTKRGNEKNGEMITHSSSASFHLPHTHTRVFNQPPIKPIRQAVQLLLFVSSEQNKAFHDSVKQLCSKTLLFALVLFVQCLNYFQFKHVLYCLPKFMTHHLFSLSKFNQVAGRHWSLGIIPHMLRKTCHFHIGWESPRF